MIVWRTWLFFMMTSVIAACSTTEVPLTCTNNADCYEDSGFICDASVTQTCLQGCVSTAECLDSEFCDPDYGVCRFGEGP